MSTDITKVLNILASYKQMDKKSGLNDLFNICNQETIDSEALRVILLNKEKLIDYLENIMWFHEDVNVKAQQDFCIEKIKTL